MVQELGLSAEREGETKREKGERVVDREREKMEGERENGSGE